MQGLFRLCQNKKGKLQIYLGLLKNLKKQFGIAEKEYNDFHLLSECYYINLFR